MTSTGTITKLVALVVLLFTGCDDKADIDQSEAVPPSVSKKTAESTQPGGNGESEASSEEAERSLDDLPDGVNTVQNEMQLLNTAMQRTLTAIANDNLETIPTHIKQVHPARQLTMKAVQKGEYRPPRNGDDMAGFKKKDEQFHENLKAMLKAAKKDDLQKVTSSYADLVEGCTDCHAKYRFDR